MKNTDELNEIINSIELEQKVELLEEIIWVLWWELPANKERFALKEIRNKIK